MRLHQMVEHPNNGWYFLLSDDIGGPWNDYDGVLLHLDSNGQYVNHFNPKTPGNSEHNAIFVKDLVIKDNGNLLILAITGLETEGEDYGSPTLFEYTPNGDRLWYKGYSDDGVYFINQSVEDARNDYWIQPTVESGFIIGRFGLNNIHDSLDKTLGHGEHYSGFFKTNLTGDIEWSSGFKGNKGSIFMGTGFLNENNTFSVITSSESDSGFFANQQGKYKTILTTFNASGELSDSNAFSLPYYPWIDINNLPFSDYNKTISLGNGEVLLIGSWTWRIERPELHNDTKNNRSDGFIISLNSSDGLNWFKSYGGSGNDYFLDAIQLKNGNILIAGHSSSSDGDLEDVSQPSNVWLVEMDLDGNIIDQYRFPVQEHNLQDAQIWKLRQADNGDIILGFRTSNHGGFVAMALTKRTTGIKSAKSETNLLVYPNPARGKINVSGLHQTLPYTISSLDGKSLMHGLCNSTDPTIEIQNLPKGVYFLRLAEQYIQRIVIE
ncbi:MAG: T9SS type A sorting domain-containing protein [Luteibaculum sp.]